MKNITKLLGLFLLINYSLMAQWTNGQNASYVIGQPDLTHIAQVQLIII